MLYKENIRLYEEVGLTFSRGGEFLHDNYEVILSLGYMGDYGELISSDNY